MRKLQTKDNRKANTGITLITLVITIAVLAILAGVSLDAILGDDGILDIAQQRSDETQEKTAKSEMQQLVLEYQLSRSEETLEEFLKEKIPDRIDKVTNNGDNTLTMEKDGYTLTVENKKSSSNGTGGDSDTGVPAEPTAETAPYFPDNTFTKKEGTTDTGLVIQDASGNEYVWVVVPRTAEVYATTGLGKTTFTDEDYASIETDLKNYTSIYRNGTSYSDTWYEDTANEGG